MNIKKNKSIIYLDWDDTLFPTSWIQQNNINVYNTTDLYTAKTMMDIDDNIYNFLSWIQKYGKIIIVTNAALEWLDHLGLILKKTKKIFNKIKIISARDQYSKQSNDPTEWKRLAFKSCTLNCKNVSSLMSIGDSDYERIAIMKLRHDVDNKINIKSVKFISDPCIKKISSQCKVLKEMMDYICGMKMDLNVDMKNIEHQLI